MYQKPKPNKKRVNKYLFDQKRILGQGSFGIVYLGVLDNESQIPELVAIKALSKKTINSDSYLKQAFVSQIKTLQKLKSPNIVGFKEVIQTEKNYYIIQEYCDGGDLEHLLQREGPIPQKKAIKLMIQILTGFFDIIRCGLVHRDFKPQNVLISKGKLKIADFGLARPAGQLLNSQVGTPLYQSPQILRGDKYTSKCDIWAIGLVFYKILYGQLPWKTPNEKNPKQPYLKQIESNSKIKFPQSIEVSQPLKEFISKCLIIQQISRADWSQLFRSEIFENNLPNYETLEVIFYGTIEQIKKKIFQSSWNIQKLYESFNSSKLADRMTRKDLHLMINKLAPNVRNHLIDFILSKFDKNSDGIITLQQFKKTLSINYLHMVFSPQELKTFIFRFKDQHQKQFQEKMQQLWKHLHSRLYEKFKQKQMKTNQLFKKYYDPKQEKKLSEEEFYQLIRDIDESLSDDQCYFLFRRFGSNNKITPNQYYDLMAKLIYQYKQK